MIPIEFPEKNFTFQKPPDMTDEECSSLDVWKGVDDNNTPHIISRWEFNKEELDDIKAGKITGVWLDLLSVGLQPVSVYTESPFSPQ